MPRPDIVATPAPGGTSLNGAASAIQSYQKGQGAEVMSAEAVRARMQELRTPSAAPENPTELALAQVDPSQRQQMAEWLADLHQTVSEAPAQQPPLFADQDLSAVEEASTTSTARKRGRPKKAATSVSVPVAAPAGTLGQPQLPALQVHFDDDGRRQTVRAHVAVLSQDETALVLSTPLAPEARYYPRPHSVVQITTQAHGTRWCYCAEFGVHVDLPGHGISSYRLVEEAEARAFLREEKLRAARELLAEAGQEPDPLSY